MPSLTGSFRLLYFFDVSEEIDIEEVRSILKLEKPDREPALRHQPAGYVRFEKAPLETRVPAIALATGEHFPARMRYFDYGVVSVEMELPFENTDWNELIRKAARWVGAQELESVAEQAVRAQLPAVQSALRKPARRVLSEDYVIIELRQAMDDDGRNSLAQQLLERDGAEIAQMVRGERGTLSATERQEVLAASMSYSPSDLLVVGWTSALIYDSHVESAQETQQLLEYANSQLLEYRHYDELLTQVLKEVYQLVDERPGIWRRWKMAREANRLNRLRLEVMELSERADNAIKFLSDMYYARAYKMAAARIGVPDSRRLVEDKLRAAGELYQFLMAEFHQGRAFVLELMVVVILIVDLVLLLGGKK
ncbi:MAG: hypothetical protein HY820_00840 [Acidobacteria bacterium]|nr:hypothetical protein [Acidobacteriota bacterium]